MSFGEGRPQPQRPFVFQDGLAIAAEFMQEIGQIAMGDGVSRLDLDGGPIMDQRGIVPPELAKHAGEFVVHLGLAGPDVQGFLVMRERLFGMVQGAVDMAEADVSFHQIGFQLQRLLVMRQRFPQFSEPLQRQSNGVVPFGRSRFAIAFGSKSCRCHFVLVGPGILRMVRIARLPVLQAAWPASCTRNVCDCHDAPRRFIQNCSTATKAQIWPDPFAADNLHRF